MEQYEKLVPGGKAALIQRAGAEVAAFLAQTFFDGVFYDIFPLAYLDATAAELSGRSLQEFVGEAMRLQAAQDLRIYGVLLRLAPPHVVLKKLVVVSSRYVDFGETTVSERRKGVTEIRHARCPLQIADWYALCAAGYAHATLVRAGARDIQIDGVEVSVPNETYAHGGLADASWRVRWS